MGRPLCGGGGSERAVNSGCSRSSYTLLYLKKETKQPEFFLIFPNRACSFHQVDKIKIGRLSRKDF
jgi:hypothetical protein